MKLEVGKTYLVKNNRLVKMVYSSAKEGDRYCMLGVFLDTENASWWTLSGECRSNADYSNIVSEVKEPEYVPFDESDNPEDIMKEIIKRGGYLKWKNGYRCVIPSIVNKSFVVAANSNIEYSDLLKDATFADNTPFGKLK